MSAIQRDGRRLIDRLVRCSARPERGAAALEFALLLPVLVMMVFGIVDFGRIYSAQLTLSQAARVAVRSAALGDTTTACSQAASAASSLGVTCPSSAVTITPCADTSDPTVSATVRITWVFTFNDPLSATVGRPSLTLSGKASLPCGG